MDVDEVVSRLAGGLVLCQQFSDFKEVLFE